MLVPLAAAIDIGPLEGDTGQVLDVPDLPRDLVATMGIARQCLHADNALAACGARVSDRDRCFDAKLVSHPRLAFGDAFQIRRVQGI